MMAVLVDTSVFIGLERRGFPPVNIINALPDETIAIAAITASELLMGAYRGDSAQRIQQRTSFVETVIALAIVMPFNLQVARTHARLWGQLKSMGQMVGAHDLQIAATALTHGYSLMTDNVRDFSRIPGLELRQLR